MHKRGYSRHVVSVCPSVCPSVRPSVTFVDHVKPNKHIFEIFLPSGSHTILVFFIPNGVAIFWREPLECRWGRQKRDSGRISGFAAYRSTVLSTVRVAKCEKQSRDRRTAASVDHSPRRPSSVVCTRRRQSVCDGLDVIRWRRREVNTPGHNPRFLLP